jgi:TctA family transporter
MDAIGHLMHGFAGLLTWKTLLLMITGLVLGIFVGVLPGLGGPNVGVSVAIGLDAGLGLTAAIPHE